MHVGLSLLTLFPGRVGGTETYVRGLLGAYAAGHGPERVTVLGNRLVAERYAEVATGPVDLHHVRSYRAGDAMPTRALAMLGARVTPRRVARDVPAGLDLMHHAVTVPIPDVPGPRVITLQDVQHHELPEFFSAFERRFRAWAYDSAARSADVVITPSRYATEGIVRHAGVDERRTVVVPYGIDHDRFTPEAAPSPELDALALPERFLVYPANLWPHKNHPRLLDALARSQDREVALLLTGQTYGRLEELGAQAARLGLGDRVRHLGYLPGAAIPELYRRALGMVFPSLFEGFGFPALEAMACGCPVAASDAGSLPEVCGDAALLFDPRDPAAVAAAIDALTGDAALRTRLAAAGPPHAATYTWAASARAHAAAYERALGG